LKKEEYKMEITFEKIRGGFMVDGLKLLKGKCGCTSIARCCYSWSKVKKRNGGIEFEAKMTTPDSKEVFNWGYTVRKNGHTVTVRVEDAGDKEIYSGFIPPSVKEWEDRGWEVIEKEGERQDGAVWRCAMCKWLYNDNREGSPFEQLPDDWQCPKCGVLKRDFEKIG
jgi:rubredoxin